MEIRDVDDDFPHLSREQAFGLAALMRRAHIANLASVAASVEDGRGVEVIRRLIANAKADLAATNFHMPLEDAATIYELANRYLTFSEEAAIKIYLGSHGSPNPEGPADGGSR